MSETNFVSLGNTQSYDEEYERYLENQARYEAQFRKTQVKSWSEYIGEFFKMSGGFFKRVVVCLFLVIACCSDKLDKLFPCVPYISNFIPPINITSEPINLKQNINKYIVISCLIVWLSRM